jgi:hypothetical protein
MTAEAGTPYAEWAFELSATAASVANYCDHIEHNEDADRAWVRSAGDSLRQVASEICAFHGTDLLALYAARLRMIEKRNPLWSPAELDGGALAESATTWRDLQLAQAAHDRRYHPDVIGLTKSDQLRHYALHLAKLAGAAADRARNRGDQADFMARRVPDMLLFGLKLATVTGESLPATGVVASSSKVQLVAS